MDTINLNGLEKDVIQDFILKAQEDDGAIGSEEQKTLAYLADIEEKSKEDIDKEFKTLEAQFKNGIRAVVEEIPALNMRDITIGESEREQGFKNYLKDDYEKYVKTILNLYRTDILEYALLSHSKGAIESSIKKSITKYTDIYTTYLSKLLVEQNQTNYDKITLETFKSVLRDTYQHLSCVKGMDGQLDEEALNSYIDSKLMVEGVTEYIQRQGEEYIGKKVETVTNTQHLVYNVKRLMVLLKSPLDYETNEIRVYKEYLRRVFNNDSMTYELGLLESYIAVTTLGVTDISKREAGIFLNDYIYPKYITPDLVMDIFEEVSIKRKYSESKKTYLQGKILTNMQDVINKCIRVLSLNEEVISKVRTTLSDLITKNSEEDFVYSINNKSYTYYKENKNIKFIYIDFSQETISNLVSYILTTRGTILRSQLLEALDYHVINVSY